MEKPGMEKAGHFRIDEKSFLDAVGAMPAVKIHSRDSSGALSPPAKESPSPEEEPPLRISGKRLLNRILRNT